MCTRVSCSDCGKPSYVGCGRHVEQVLGNVPKAERCRCREEGGAEAKPERSLLERMFGKP
jgi:hypothetical protein